MLRLIGNISKVVLIGRQLGAEKTNLMGRTMDVLIGSVLEYLSC